MRVILVEPSHPGNIGSVARAMKTMGLSELVLVNPKEFPSKEAIIMASHADDVLEQAKVYPTLDEALADCQLIFATSAREREVEWPLMAPRQAMEKVAETAVTSAVMFGRERTGLTNEELRRAHVHIHIPTNPHYASLNLAQAVQVLAYEWRLAFVENEVTGRPHALANDEEREGFYRHFEQALHAVEFFRHENAKHQALLARFRRLFQKAELEQEEVKLLRGVCAAMERSGKA